jgi:hypothetical protein
MGKKNVEYDTVLPCNTMSMQTFFIQYCCAYARAQWGIKSNQYKGEFMKWQAAAQTRFAASYEVIFGSLKGLKGAANSPLKALMQRVTLALAKDAAARLGSGARSATVPFVKGVQSLIEAELGARVRLARGCANFATLQKITA